MLSEPQLLDMVYTAVAVPADTPVSKPEPGLIDAVAAGVALHVPPDAASCRVTDVPTQTESVPVTALITGNVSTVIEVVAVALPQLVVFAV